MDVQFVASVAPIVRDAQATRSFEARTEPWSQITARLLSPEGLLVAVCYTPSLHDTPDS